MLPCSRLSRRLRRLACAWAAVLVLCAVPLRAQTPQTGVASLVVDLATGRTLSVERPDVMTRAVLPGSVMKVAAVAAALEAGAISERTTVLCTRRIVVDGHTLTCTHPDLHRPMRASEALAQSCNVFVATVSARVPRSAFDSVLASMGLPASAAGASVRASALGLEGTRMTPLSLVQALARVASADGPRGWKPSTTAVVRQGLHDAVQSGTASALSRAGIDALAKTGTVDAGGISQGLIVGVSPSVNPTVGFALLASGGAGRDAAALMAERLRSASALRATERPTTNDQRPAPRATATQAAQAPTSDLRPASALRATARQAEIRIGVMQADGRYVVRAMAMDDYVAGVVAGEATPGAPAAALEALAVAVRTYATTNAGRHAKDGFDLCDLTHCQVLRRATAGTTAAAQRTSGEVLTLRGTPAEVFYTASCGGHTARPSEVWRGAANPAFLPSHADEACANEAGWTSDLSARDLLRALRAGGFSGDTIRGLTVTSRTGSRRVAWLRVDGVTPAEVSGENLRTLVGRTLGWQHLRSTLFEVTRTSTGFRFTGRGAGHGVGLCVAGAAVRAAAGATRADILRAYYPGLDVTTKDAAAPNVRVVLPTEDEASRRQVVRLVASSLDAVAARLHAPVPPAIVVRFHPTVESYQRATGRAWFTAGSTRGTQVDLLPLSTLRTRGLLDVTLRHELAHVVTSASMEGQPLWMREGAAVWAEQARPPDRGTAAAPRVSESCPSDDEFGRAASAEALRGLYDRARACYEKAGKLGSW